VCRRPGILAAFHAAQDLSGDALGILVDVVAGDAEAGLGIVGGEFVAQA
jgi:hypothetical protein